MAISTNGTIITRLAGSLYGEYLSNASYTELNTTAAATVAANMLTNDFAGKTDAQIATTVLTNLSLTTVAGLDNWVAAQLTAAGSTAAAKGAKLVSMLNDYAMMTADATYGASATSFNSKVSAALVLSQTTGNAGGSFATAGTVAANGGTFTLTTGADLAGVNVGSNGGVASTFRFTSGNETVSALTATTAGSDTLIDGSTTDADEFNLTATGAMTALTAINIETANVTFASGTPSAIFTNFSGLNTVNVTGAVAGTVEDAGTSTIALDGYKRVVTVDIDSLAGTSSTATADVLNVSVSGTTYGSTSSTRSGISVTIQSAADATDGTLETLNITSVGTAANNYSLAKDADTTLSTVNLLGATAQTLRVAHDVITGVAVVGTSATADTNVRVNRETFGTTATNVVSFAGIDDLIIADDAATPAAALALTGVAAAQRITVVDDMASSSSIAMAGTSVGVNAASLTLVLDNDTADTDTDIAGTLTIDNATALNLVSNGFATSSSDASAENALTLDGDFTTITITGDTSISLSADIDPAGSTEATARAVSITAAGMTGTARATISAATDSLVTYTITGTSNNDTLTANASGNTLTGGAGNDTLTGGTKNDVISGGDGNDVIYASPGTDTVTLGDATDTVIFGEADVAVSVGTDTITLAETASAGDTIAITVNGTARTYTVTTADVAATTAALDLANIEDSLVTFINSSYAGVVLASNTSSATAVTISGISTGDATPTVTTVVTSSSMTAAVTETAAGLDAVAVDTRISDFGSTDVITFDLSEMNGVSGVDNLVDSTDDLASTDDIAFIAYTAGTALGASSIAAAANLVKVAYSTAINSASELIALMGNGITLDSATGSNTDALLVVFYDADDGVMRVGFMQDTDADASSSTTGEFDDTNNTFNEIAAVTMTGVAYTALTAANFDIIA